MTKIFLSSLLILGFWRIAPLLAERVRTDHSRQGETKSSSTRGCQEKLPEITLQNPPLYQENPQIQISASEEGFEVVISIYPIAFNQTEHWQTKVITQSRWMTIETPVMLKENQKYAVALTIPCNGDVRSGEKIYKVIELTAEDMSL